jgi:ABC-type multidrug transport system fused ATPase/permease subunit
MTAQKTETKVTLVSDKSSVIFFWRDAPLPKIGVDDARSHVVLNGVILFIPSTRHITMHIKQITISNFRSFKQQPEIHPFSPGTNAIVGRNGSGKSNLFDAMQFVLLSPRFQTLRSVRGENENVYYSAREVNMEE